MRIFLFILLGFVLGAAAPVWGQDEAQDAAESAAIDEAPFDNSTLREDGQIIAFVGRKVFVREDENWPPNDPDVIYLDSRYEAQYIILDRVSGEYAGDSIDFHAYDHYGMPRFSKPDNILIFVHDGPDSRVHSKYNYYEVHRTTDGDWAACGDDYYSHDPDDRANNAPLEPIPFLEPVTLNIPSIMHKITDYFEEGEVVTDTERAEVQSEIDADNEKLMDILSTPIWKREGDTATCLLGGRVDDLYEYENQTRFLPNKRKKICRTHHSAELEALGEDWKAKRQLIDDCTALLKIQNLP